MQDASELKGLALQIAAQLPSDRRTALSVLDFVREIVEWRDGRTAKAELYVLPREAAE